MVCAFYVCTSACTGGVGARGAGKDDVNMRAVLPVTVMRPRMTAAGREDKLGADHSTQVSASVTGAVTIASHGLY